MTAEDHVGAAFVYGGIGWARNVDLVSGLTVVSSSDLDPRPAVQERDLARFEGERPVAVVRGQADAAAGYRDELQRVIDEGWITWEKGSRSP
ncbi:hypothetical protein [Streptomyces sp. B3I8]|uniref:hypothetical protein n=1 Tax=Streptomyces sp. B3I8 TaxID=3042303 RepID=UPI0027889D53|nr:hypothetical protein [Streptomyces sp. B3I8]MDQ0790793.1 hypothetical protein [Streptomyces sp. B3I8]